LKNRLASRVASSIILNFVSGYFGNKNSLILADFRMFFHKYVDSKQRGVKKSRK